MQDINGNELLCQGHHSKSAPPAKHLWVHEGRVFVVCGVHREGFAWTHRDKLTPIDPAILTPGFQRDLVDRTQAELDKNMREQQRLTVVLQGLSGAYADTSARLEELKGLLTNADDDDEAPTSGAPA